jgi:hypothetical protein
MKPRTASLAINRTVWACVLVALASSCSKSVRVPPADYGNPGGAAAYRIVTTDNRHFSASRYTASDSTIVIEEFATSTDPDSLPAVPLTIPRRDVASIDRVEMDRGKTSGWVLGLGAFFLAVLFLGAGLSIGSN